MDDRFHTEDKNLNGNNSDFASYNTAKRSGLGDFSENIETKSGDGLNFTPKTGKFQVHIADYDNLPEEVVETPPQPRVQPRPVQKRPISAQPAAQRRTAGSRAPVRNGAPAGKKVAPQKRVSGNLSDINSNFTDRSERKAAAKAPVKKADIKKSVIKNADTKKAPAKSSAQARRKARKRYNFIKNLLISCVCIIFISIITASVSSVALGFLNDVLVISDDSDYTAIVEIPEGAKYDDVFAALCDNGLVRQPFLTDFFLRFRHYDSIEVYDKTTETYVTKEIQYEPGKYYLEYSDGIETMIESIMVKQNYAKDTVRLTFPEGWNIAQIFEKIEKYEVCEADKLYANLDIVAEQYGFITEIDPVSGRYLLAEGYLFPDTYDFFVGESASSVLKKLFNNFSAKWQEDYNDQLKKLGMTRDEIITIASIIQREAKDGSQMKDISSVIHNRLADATNFPNIQMNSTTDYITNLKPYNVFTDTYYSIYLEQYNTYSNQGLPPGPICNPGIKAIEAALYPSDTGYYFFCHDTSGNVYYAETAQEHEANTSKVLYGDLS